MTEPLKPPKLPEPPPPSKDRRHDKALEDTFPASDPVPLKPPKRDPAPTGEKTAKLKPTVTISDEAMPAEKPM